ncbi:MAG: xanthine dehydrogenase family protein subunit M [Pseudomonadales bacterium]
MTAYDVMPDIELFQPVTVEDAATLAARLGADGWLLAGGQDTYGWLKDRARHPRAMIDLAAVTELQGVRELGNGLSIGAMTSLTELIRNPLVKARFDLLVQAAGRVASPQIRNQGTLGGNLAQDTRCWYYRRGLSCYRAGGNICYADGPKSMNREHAVFGASRCVAVTPSDTAVALMALDAVMVIQNSRGVRRVNVTDFFVGPAVNIRHMTVLRPGDVLTAIEIPDTFAGADFYFEKVADRNVWDFALVSVAAAYRMKGGLIDDARLVLGAVECVPRRLRDIERAAIGKARSEETAGSLAGFASRGARPLNHNHFKLPLMENLVARALRS